MTRIKKTFPTIDGATLCSIVQTPHWLLCGTTEDYWEENGKFGGISPAENSCCHQVGDFVVLGLFPQHASVCGTLWVKAVDWKCGFTVGLNCFL